MKRSRVFEGGWSRDEGVAGEQLKTKMVREKKGCVASEVEEFYGGFMHGREGVLKE